MSDLYFDQLRAGAARDPLIARQPQRQDRPHEQR
jgi:hypothetical protein